MEKTVIVPALLVNKPMEITIPELNQGWTVKMMGAFHGGGGMDGMCPMLLILEKKDGK